MGDIMDSLVAEGHYFTCLTCRMEFVDEKFYRAHYTTDYHRYNIRRKILDLRIVSLTEFEKRQQGQTCNLVYKNNAGKESFYCELCHKKYNSEKQYQNHLMTKKHKDIMEKSHAKDQLSDVLICTAKRVAQINRELERKKLDVLENVIETDSSPTTPKIAAKDIPFSYVKPILYCLFCLHRSETIYHNLYHMKKKHSFFIPDEKYCTNLEDLLLHLTKKIWIRCKCLWCNDSGRRMRSGEAVRSHMIDKGHCRMFFDGKAVDEYSKFYNYSSSYPDADTANPSEVAPEPEVLNDEGYDMKLPTGKTIGHRSLYLYYKQYLPPSRPSFPSYSPYHDEREIAHRSDFNRRLFALYMRTESLTRRIQEAIDRRKRSSKLEERERAKSSIQLQLQQNKLQKHFRPQIRV